MSRVLISEFPTLGTKSTSANGYLFLSESDSKKYCEDEEFRISIYSQIDIKNQLFLSSEILLSIKDLHLLKTIYGVYYKSTFSLSNVDELRYFDLNQSEKIIDFNLYCVENPSKYVEIYNHLSYLHLVMYDIKIGIYCLLTIGYENAIV